MKITTGMLENAGFRTDGHLAKDNPQLYLDLEVRCAFALAGAGAFHHEQECVVRFVLQNPALARVLGHRWTCIDVDDPVVIMRSWHGSDTDLALVVTPSAVAVEIAGQDWLSGNHRLRAGLPRDFVDELRRADRLAAAWGRIKDVEEKLS